MAIAGGAKSIAHTKKNQYEYVHKKIVFFLWRNICNCNMFGTDKNKATENIHTEKHNI